MWVSLPACRKSEPEATFVTAVNSSSASISESVKVTILRRRNPWRQRSLHVALMSFTFVHCLERTCGTLSESVPPDRYVVGIVAGPFA